MNLWTIFLTGLTTGGLSCLAMQGGLLASTIANQKEDELESTVKNIKKYNKKTSYTSAKSFDQLDWLPVTMFLAGKLLSHTIFGFFLGFLGSKLELSLGARLFFQGAAVFFMFATAMNLLEVHPIFRYVVFQPPKFFTRLVRNTTRSKAVFTPFVIGVLTLLIPCGVTQSMEVLAMSSGSPILGATIMFAFVLGTSPLFGIIGVGVAKLSEVWTKYFMKIAAASLIYLSAVSVNGILVVVDAPITYQKLKAAALLDLDDVAYSNVGAVANQENGKQSITVNIVSSGYSPQQFQVKQGIPVDMTLVSNNNYTCANDFIFPAFNVKARLGATDKKTLTFTPNKKGRYTFSCSMGMYVGSMVVI